MSLFEKPKFTALVNSQDAQADKAKKRGKCTNSEILFSFSKSVKNKAYGSAYHTEESNDE